MNRLMLVAAGGLAREALAVERALGRFEQIRVVDENPDLWGGTVGGEPVLGGLDLVPEYDDHQLLVCAGRGSSRRAIVRRLLAMGVGHDRFARTIHPSVVVPDSCTVGTGSILLAGVVLTADVHVGEHVVVMPNATLTHDDVVEDYATVCAGVSLGGGVRVGQEAYVGMNAAVRAEPVARGRLHAGHGRGAAPGASGSRDLGGRARPTRPHSRHRHGGKQHEGAIGRSGRPAARGRRRGPGGPRRGLRRHRVRRRCRRSGASSRSTPRSSASTTASASPTAPTRSSSRCGRSGSAPGGEVILPANTFIATAEAVSRIGAAPVLGRRRRRVPADRPRGGRAGDHAADRRRSCPSTSSARRRPSSGSSPLANAAGVPIVEDAAQSQGARRHGRPAGSLGRVAATSFYPGKNLGAAGDAGAVMTDDAEIARAGADAGRPRLADQVRARRDRHELPARHGPGGRPPGQARPAREVERPAPRRPPTRYHRAARRRPRRPAARVGARATRTCGTCTSSGSGDRDRVLAELQRGRGRRRDPLPDAGAPHRRLRGPRPGRRAASRSRSGPRARSSRCRSTRTSPPSSRSTSPTSWRVRSPGTWRERGTADRDAVARRRTPRRPSAGASSTPR